MRFPFLPIVLLSAALIPGSAHASATFPPAIQKYFTPPLPAEPGCTLCHRDDNGGKGTIATPFGLALLNNYVVKGNDNTAALVAALAAMKADQWDSDGDGDPDVDELANGTDPNMAPIRADLPETPQLEYGCSIRTGRHGIGTGWPVIALLGGALLWRGRRERRRRDGARS